MSLRVEDKRFWILNFFALTIGGFLYLNFLSNFKSNLLNEMADAFELLSIPVYIILFQLILSIVIGKIWDADILHIECWKIRFKYLPIILFGIPLLLWVTVWGQNLEGFIKNLLHLTALIYLLLYGFGIANSAINYIKKSTSPWYLGFSYLCALEIAPVFWALF